MKVFLGGGGHSEILSIAYSVCSAMAPKFHTTGCLLILLSESSGFLVRLHCYMSEILKFRWTPVKVLSARELVYISPIIVSKILIRLLEIFCWIMWLISMINSDMLKDIFLVIQSTNKPNTCIYFCINQRIHCLQKCVNVSLTK
jgi:uncharacterized membrane protein